jgi:hypothetical protein
MDEPEASDTRARTRVIARDVLVEALGASATPFVPVPFVDDLILARLLRRVAGKVLARHGLEQHDVPRVVTEAYLAAGSPALVSSILVGAARFVVRKVAVVLDVKKSYEAFGAAIAFALGLDIASSRGWLHEASAERVGAALHRAMLLVSSGALAALGRAGREAYARGGGLGPLADAIGVELDATREQLEAALGREIERPASR